MKSIVKIGAELYPNDEATLCAYFAGAMKATEIILSKVGGESRAALELVAEVSKWLEQNSRRLT